MTNNVASKYWTTTSEPLLPSSYLNIALDDVQPLLFNPTMSDVILLPTAEANTFRWCNEETLCNM